MPTSLLPVYIVTPFAFAILLLLICGDFASPPFKIEWTESPRCTNSSSPGSRVGQPFSHPRAGAANPYRCVRSAGTPGASSASRRYLRVLHCIYGTSLTPPSSHDYENLSTWESSFQAWLRPRDVDYTVIRLVFSYLKEYFSIYISLNSFHISILLMTHCILPLNNDRSLPIIITMISKQHR